MKTHAATILCSVMLIIIGALLSPLFSSKQTPIQSIVIFPIALGAITTVGGMLMGIGTVIMRAITGP